MDIGAYFPCFIMSSKSSKQENKKENFHITEKLKYFCQLIYECIVRKILRI